MEKFIKEKACEENKEESDVMLEIVCDAIVDDPGIFEIFVDAMQITGNDLPGLFKESIKTGVTKASKDMKENSLSEKKIENFQTNVEKIRGLFPKLGLPELEFSAATPETLVEGSETPREAEPPEEASAATQKPLVEGSETD